MKLKEGSTNAALERSLKEVGDVLTLRVYSENEKGLHGEQ